MTKRYPNTKRNYRTEIDLFIEQFNANRAQEDNPMRKKEIEKHAKIANRRDNAIDDAETGLWQDF